MVIVIMQVRKSVRVVVITVFLLAIGLMVLSSTGSGTALGAPPAQGGGTPTPTPGPRRIPPNEPARGLVFDGLEPDIRNVCKGAFKLRDTNHCTHGPDPVPPGVNIQSSAAPVQSVNAPLAATGVQCDGDGSTGNRTQVMYVRPSDRADRYSTYLASFQQWAADADQIYRDSAAETGGYRSLRFVHDAGCNVIVLNVIIPGTGNVDFNTMVSQLSSLGYNRSDRKYMIFMDVSLYCGIGSLNSDDSASQSNANNSGPDYARADTSCWSGSTIAHESMHNMGAVQRSAPHSTYLQNQTSSNTWHCSDEYDRMCYVDADGVVMTYLCSSSSHDRLFDCNHDDYFSTNPAPGSYLATHWNSANNRFLLTTAASPTPTRTPVPVPLGGFRQFLPVLVK